MDVLTEELFYVSLGLCGVCLLNVVVHEWLGVSK